MRTHLHAAPCGEPTLGVWCDDCMLPSAVRFRLAVTICGGPAWMTTATVCQDCGREDGGLYPDRDSFAAARLHEP